MADGPNWADIASAVGTCTTGVIAIILSWRAFALEHKKMNHDLYSERKKLYDKVNKLYIKFSNAEQRSNIDFSFSELQDVDDIVLQTPALFSRQVSDNIFKMRDTIYVSLGSQENSSKNNDLYIKKLRFITLKVRNQMDIEFTKRSGIFATISKIQRFILRKYKKYYQKIFCRNRAKLAVETKKTDYTKFRKF
ncbi:hypothetical protein JL101_036070 (plasmid) [Skermanella rosea]|uniref:hypothetical protein n=1 Tax=Skermanella rosea TaxID=1817965 RepID=UPI00193142E7|nr:hypothetical protein [Skermanella rosea]UEM08176.1 hypothetical protein JL101_036070 [Skermanella rosea]